ncbi:MAG: Ig-like domain repeat protein, partial [Spirochaetaceae bacterium]|nr:Ig-like domain repeat protein [Spirochaetaceae bacterium]
MNKIMRNTTLTILLSMLISPLFGEKVDFESAVGSSSLSLENAVENIIDNSGSSYTGFQPFSDYADIKLNLTADGVKKRIKGVNLSIYLPETVSAGIEYEVDGERFTAMTAVTGEISSDIYLDLSRERIVADSLYLVIGGELLEEARIHNVTAEIEDPVQMYRPAVLRTSVSDESNPYVYNGFLLTDGNIETQWRLNERKNLENILNSIIDFLPSMFSKKIWNKSDDSRVVSLAADKPAVSERISLYINNNSDGLMGVEYRVDTDWIHLAELDLNSEPEGWKDFDLSGLPVVEEIRFTLDRSGQNKGGIGEVQLWSYQGVETEQRLTLLPFSPSGRNHFFFESGQFPDYPFSMRALTAVSSESPVIELNGFPLDFATISSTESFEMLEIELPGELIADDYNVLSINTEFLAVEAFGKTEQGRIIPISIDPVLNDSSFYGTVEITDSLTIAGGKNDTIRQMYIHYDLSAPYAVLQLIDGEYIPLYPDSDKAGRQSYKPEEGCREIVVQGGLLSEVELYGLPSATAEDEVLVLSPGLESWFRDSDNRSYITGISTVSDSETLKINGVQAKTDNNLFWLDSHAVFEKGQEIQNLVFTVTEGKTETVILERKTFVPFVLNSLHLNQGQELHYTETDFFIFTGTVDPSFNGDLYINGQSVGIQGKQFTHTASVVKGINRISIQVTNKKNELIHNEYRRVYRYPGPMEIVVRQPEDGSTVVDTTTSVYGQILNDIPSKVTVNGVEAERGIFTFQSSSDVQLNNPINEITVKAWGVGGRTAERTVYVYKDTDAPVLSDISPDPGSWFNDSTIEVSGSVYDEYGASVFVNGIQASQHSGFFNAFIPVSDGENTITIHAVDKAGNRTDLAPFTVRADSTGPDEFSLTTDSPGWTNNVTPIIYFDAVDSGIGLSHYTVSIGGRDFIPQVSPFLLPYQDDGIHEIAVRAYDKLGNFSEEELDICIDTLPPDTAGNFRAVPGNNLVELRWFEDDEDSLEYKYGLIGDDQNNWLAVLRNEGYEAVSTEDIEGLDELAGNIYFKRVFENLENGTEYTFGIIAIDRAGNIGEIVEAGTTVGYTLEDVSDEGTFVEYADLNLMISGDALPEDISGIIITEAVSDNLEEAANYPILSPIYHFAVEKTDGTIEDHVQFDEPFVAFLDYDDSLVPDGFPEENLDVYYFDTMWSQWYIVEDALVDTENNTIVFSTNHFTDFSVQPTVVEDLSPQQLQDVEFSPFSEKIVHAPVNVSTQGGTMSTSMTDLFLPGKNGFDLEI